MASDFYTLLKQSIIERGISDASERVEVYAQARRAMIRQLWAYEPPLAEHEIDRRIGEFDAAVERIETVVAAAFADAPADQGASAEGKGGDSYDGSYAYGEAEAAEVKIAAGADGAGGRDRVGARDRAEDFGRPTLAYEGDPYDEDDGGGGRLADEAAASWRPYREAPPEDARRLAARHAAAAAPDTDRPPGYDEDEEPHQTRQPDRWSGPMGREPPPEHQGVWRAIGERDKVRILIGAIGVFVMILAGLALYVAQPAGDDGVVVPIGVRRDVSDAATASRIAAETLAVEESFVIFDGRDPTIFETSANNPVRLDADSQGAFARVASSVGAAGVKVRIGPGLAAQLAGRQIRVVISARSARERGAAGMRFAYQSGFAISHWQTANLPAQYGAVALIWRTPAQRTDPAGDYLLIEPGVPGAGTGADIRSIRIDLLASS